MHLNLKAYFSLQSVYSLYDTEEVDVCIVYSEVIEQCPRPSLNPQFITQVSKNILRCTSV